MQLVGRRPPREITDKLLPAWCRAALAARQAALAATRGASSQPAEVEVAFAPDGGHFSQSADCRVLIVPRGAVVSSDLARRADLIFAESEVPGVPPARLYPLGSLDAILRRQLGAPRTSGSSTPALARVA